MLVAHISCVVLLIDYHQRGKLDKVRVFFLTLLEENDGDNESVDTEDTCHDNGHD